ncbi:neuromedin-K receptor-like isoform X1 [Dermacentor albipictus]|uniref:neuromedin-K receptor-like isoform X1 n=1 Tax=Dermacentor albipictus TaxID=60249 RepID=UPI0031FCA57E
MASSLLLGSPTDYEPYSFGQGETLTLNRSWGSPSTNPADSEVDADASSSVAEDRLYEVPVEVIVLLSVCYGAISLVAVVGNTFVLWIVATSRRMRTETNYLIANLAISDIIIGLFSIPFHFQAALLQRWLLPRFMCAFCPFVQVLSVNVSIFTLTAIAVDRYRAITIPLKARLNSRLTARVLIGVIWVASAMAAAPYAFALRVTLVEDERTGERTRPFCHNVALPPSAWRVYNNALVCSQYFAPLLVICYVYERIRRLLKDSTIPGNPESVRDAIVVRNKKKVTKMMFIVVAIFALCWLPYQTYNILTEIYPEINSYRYINVIWFCCHWLAMSNSCYNPFIYAIYSEKFNAEFQARIRCCARRHHDEIVYGHSSIMTQLSVRLQS